MNSTDLARVAYTAYGLTTDFKNYRGDPMPAWDELPPKIQQAWRNAARAAFGRAVDELLAIATTLEHDTAAPG